jgi:hypothetical protein
MLVKMVMFVKYIKNSWMQPFLLVLLCMFGIFVILKSLLYAVEPHSSHEYERLALSAISHSCCKGKKKFLKVLVVKGRQS